MSQNETHERCPGECICSKPLSVQQLSVCYGTAVCPKNMKAIPVIGGSNDGNVHDEECCPKYNCTCDACPEGTVTKEEITKTVNEDLCEKVVIKKSDENEKCCQNYEIQCNDACKCKYCNTTKGCAAVNRNICGCSTCECDQSMCPSITCGSCQELVSIYPKKDPEAACFGNCCEEQKCVNKSCNPIPETVIPDHCTFLKQIPTFGDDKCCPDGNKIDCIGIESCPYDVISDCQYGYDLVTVSVQNSTDPNVNRFADCEKVDECCPHRKCVCKLCTVDNIVMKLGDAPVYYGDGCTRYSCDSGKKLQNGCYEISKLTPTCTEIDQCKCYEEPKIVAAPGGAKNMTQWQNLCCPKYSCDTKPCSSSYDKGVTSCPPPSVLKITSEEVTDGCENPECPIGSCECNVCTDHNGSVYEIGITYPGKDECENITCLRDENETCPYLKVNREPCEIVECDKYHDEEVSSSAGDCCESYSCRCKPYEELKDICENWKSNDTDRCPDPDHMIVETLEGKYQDSDCCPEKSCKCKGEDTRNCEKWTDYKCPSVHQTRVQTVDMNEINCCPDYDCVCNCSKVDCGEYDSWVATSDQEDCACECTCDTTKCTEGIPECAPFEDLVLNGKKKDECCPDYECICNITKCLEPESITCNEFQEQYDWYRTHDACCPDEKRCRCKSDHDELTELCKIKKNTEPGNCTEGWEPYIANVTANVDEGMCCDIQCRCVSCHTDTGEVKEVGSTWDEVINCTKYHYTCSEEKLSNGCHKIKTKPSAISCEYNSLETYEVSNCNKSYYAVKLPKSECCEQYECKPCSTTNRTCASIFETMSQNETHERCPGECICSKPLSLQQLSVCYGTAVCPKNMKAIPVIEGSNDGNVHDEECCPKYNCTCDTCPEGTVTKEEITKTVNKDLCEKVVIKKSNENEKCCQNYKIQCNDACKCKPCNTTKGCVSVNRNICGCSTCECDQNMCPSITCGLCEELVSKYPDKDPEAACFGDCCEDLNCVPKTCPTKTPITCNTFQKPYPTAATNDNCCPDDHCECIRDESVLNETCGGIYDVCSEGYEITYKDPDTKCCPECSCNSCTDDDGNIKSLGFEWSEKHGNCISHKLCSSQKGSDGCYIVNTTYSEEDSCTSKELYKKKYCANLEVPYETENPYGCCKHYKCECSQNETMLRQKCDDYDGIKCDPFQISEFVYEDECCPVYSCRCDNTLCEYKCPTGDSAKITDESDPDTNNCCKKYSCVCETCDLGGGLFLKVGESRTEEQWHGCNITKTCERKAPSVCEISEKNPLHDCQTLDQYQKQSCNTPYQIAFETGSRLKTNLCCNEYECKCNNTETNCPNATSLECHSSQKPVADGVMAGTSDCCQKYTCKCEDQDVLKDKCLTPDGYQCSEDGYIAEKVHSDDPCCPNYTCTCNPNTCTNVSISCNPGDELYDTKEGECCPTYKCRCNLCKVSDKVYEVGEEWNVTVGNCRTTKVCSSAIGSDGCHVVKSFYSERDNCLEKDEIQARFCHELETAKAKPLSNKCCTEYECECTTDMEILKTDCKDYDGIDCGSHMTSIPTGNLEKCCPTHKCICNNCDYTCHTGFTAVKLNVTSNETANCCFEYTCVCDTCESDNGKLLKVGESMVTQRNPGCNITEMCKKADDECTISKWDPIVSCQTKKQYEVEHCKTPYQTAVDTGSYLENNLCCSKYECRCNNTAMNCPKPPTNCFESQKITSVGVVPDTGDCCDDYICSCKNSTELEGVCTIQDCTLDGYKRQDIASTDPCCKNYTCLCDPTTCENYESRTCEKGYEVVLIEEDECCSNFVCRCNACVSNGVVHEVNSSWWEDSCYILTCSPPSEGGKCPDITSQSRYSCDPIDVDECESKGGIVRGTEETNNCCKECTLCKRVERKMNLTRIINGEECRAVDSVDVGSCEGACPTEVEVNWITGQSNAVCACCEPSIRNSTIMMLCGPQQRQVSTQIVISESCKCTNEP